MAEAKGGSKEVARKWLQIEQKDPEDQAARWMRWQPDGALRLMAWSAIDPNAPETTAALDKLLNDRNPYGHWRTTWVNAWSLLAMAQYSETEDLTPTPATLIVGDESQNLQVAANRPVITRRLGLQRGMKLSVKAEGTMIVRLRLASKPKIAPMQPVSAQGMEITRFYEKVNSDGSREPLGKPKIGDVVRVSLRVTLPEDDMRYLVIEDRLPGTFEAVNESFASQATVNAGNTSQNEWTVSHNEVRADRVMFFLDRCYHRGTRTLTYHARVTLEGTAYAPPAKVEAMYDPERLALSASRVFKVD